jgi:TRAP-type C4-dicarboxylate transport system permease small subunit
MSEDGAREPTVLPTGAMGVLVRGAMGIGSAAMLGAMATEALAVVGRHTGVPFVGSIELVQACVVVATSSAIVAATVLGAHARVHLLTERLGPTARGVLYRLADLLSAALFAVLAGGSIWIATELWTGDERTSLLHLPIAALRVFWCAAAALTGGLFLIAAFARKDRP